MAEISEVILPSNDSNSANYSGFEWPSDAASINSSITAYRMENGRRYDGESRYWAPNDDRQNENLDINNHLFSLMQNGRLHLAPLEKDIKRVLDIGTGTGIWAIDFADEYPECQVIGTDISAIQPGMVPPNCGFLMEDCEVGEWDYGPAFDYIHIRTMFGCIKDWPALYARAYKNLKPGGWIEHFEVSTEVQSDDNTVKPDSPLANYSKIFRDASKAMGVPFVVTGTMKDDVGTAGFNDVQEYILKAPLGRWPADARLKEIGAWCELSFNTGLEGWAMKVLTQYLDWNANEVQVFLAQVRQDAKNKRIHSYYNITVVIGQKPYDDQLTPSATNDPLDTIASEKVEGEANAPTGV